MRAHGSLFTVLIAALTIGGCSSSYSKDDWLIVSHEDTGIERVSYVTDSLKACDFRLSQFQWSPYVYSECATGCAPASDDRIDCDTTASRNDYLARPPASVRPKLKAWNTGIQINI